MTGSPGLDAAAGSEPGAEPSARAAARPASARRRLWALRILLVLSPLWAELALRAYAHWRENERGMSYHAEFGWRPMPSVRKSGRYWGREQVAFTNERGWRDDPAVLGRVDGARRIVALGDSFTFGVLVDHGERFSEHLERSLPRTEVINLGVTGYGTDQELRVLEEEGFAYEPDVVVLVAFLSNDLLDIQYEQNLGWPKPWYELGAQGLVHHAPEASWITRVRASSYLGELVARVADRWHPSARLARDRALDDPAPLFVALVRRMHELCAARDVRFLAVLAYRREQRELGRAPAETRILHELRASGIAVLDTLDLLRTSADRSLDHYGPDGHWSPTGHRVLAGAIEADLRARGWLEH